MDNHLQVKVPLLSVVAIGRNEESNIEKLAESISYLASKLSSYVQTIFVDSASSDDTCKAALRFFDEVYVLEESPWLCAASGRALGTLQARGKWILYLDGDMELCREFADIAEHLLEKDEDVSGYIGRYIYMFPDGKSLLRTFGCQREGDRTPAIGGSVLLRRDEVLNSGNWDPSVFSGEEMELYSRLRGGERTISYLDVPLVFHHTQKYSRRHNLLKLLVPSLGLGKKWYGFGQILAARLRKRNLCTYIKMAPYPFICWSGISLGFLFGSAVSWVLGASIVIATLTFVSVKQGWKTLVIHTAKIIPALVGWTKYSPGYTPVVISAFRRLDSKLSLPGVPTPEKTVSPP